MDDTNRSENVDQNRRHGLRCWWPTASQLAGVLALLMTAGCGKLSKQQADALLRKNGVVLAAQPVCSVHLPSGTRLMPWGIDLGYGTDTKDCADRLLDAGLLARTSKVHEIKSRGIYVETQRQDVRLTCKDSGGGTSGLAPWQENCAAEFPCGSADLVVDSITTEDKAATVRYTVTRTVDANFEKWPRTCEIEAPFARREAKFPWFTLTAVGGWVGGR
jgi:hypothetical protein